jgi:chromosomal replication initiation ATPase DnaA
VAEEVTLYRRDDILEAVENTTGVRWGDIASRNREPRVRHAREVLCHCLRKWTLMSYPEIARYISTHCHESSHSGVCDRVKRFREDTPVEDRRKVEAQVQLKIPVDCKPWPYRKPITFNRGRYECVSDSSPS